MEEPEDDWEATVVYEYSGFPSEDEFRLRLTLGNPQADGYRGYVAIAVGMPPAEDVDWGQLLAKRTRSSAPGVLLVSILFEREGDDARLGASIERRSSLLEPGEPFGFQTRLSVQDLENSFDVSFKHENAFAAVSFANFGSSRDDFTLGLGQYEELNDLGDSIGVILSGTVLGVNSTANVTESDWGFVAVDDFCVGTCTSSSLGCRNLTLFAFQVPNLRLATSSSTQTAKYRRLPKPKCYLVSLVCYYT